MHLDRELLLGPSPLGQPLVVEFPCRMDPRQSEPHRSRIDGAWSTTPLPDAFWHWSGHMACWWAFDRAATAARHGANLVSRLQPPAITRQVDGWRPLAPLSGQTPRTRPFSDARLAAREARSPYGLAFRFGADEELVRLIMGAVDIAHGGLPRLIAGAVHGSYVFDDWLWDVGVPPSFVVETAQLAEVSPSVIGRHAYLAAALALGPAASTLPVDGAQRMAHRTGLSVQHARARSDEWRLLNPRVTENEQVLVHYLAHDSSLPSRASLQRFTNSIGVDQGDVRCALVLAIAHNVPMAEGLWRRGVRDPLVVAGHV